MPFAREQIDAFFVKMTETDRAAFNNGLSSKSMRLGFKMSPVGNWKDDKPPLGVPYVKGERE